MGTSGAVCTAQTTSAPFPEAIPARCVRNLFHKLKSFPSVLTRSSRLAVGGLRSLDSVSFANERGIGAIFERLESAWLGLLRLHRLTIAAPACVALQVGPQRIAQHRPCPPPRLHVAR